MRKLFRATIQLVQGKHLSLLSKKNSKIFKSLSFNFRPNFTTTQPPPVNPNPIKNEAETKFGEMFSQHDKEFRQNIQKGVEFLEKGKLDQAMDIFFATLRSSDIIDGHLNHGSAVACYYLGRCHQIQGEFEKALNYFERTVECLLHEKSTRSKVTVQAPGNADEKLKKQLEEINKSASQFSEKNKRFELPEAEINQLYGNVVEAVSDLEKSNFYGPLSSYIRKEGIAEQFSKMPELLKKPDENKKLLASLCFQMGDILRIERNNECAKIKMTGVEFFEDILKNDPEELLSIYLETGQFFNKLNIHKKSEEYYLKALPLIEKVNPDIRADAMFNLQYKGLAVTYTQLTNFEKALVAMKATIELIENALKERASVYEKATVYYETGHILKKMKKDNEILPFWSKALIILEGAGEKKVAGRICQEIGDLHEKINDLTSAKESFEKCFGFYKEALGEEHPALKEVKEALERINLKLTKISTSSGKKNN